MKSQILVIVVPTVCFVVLIIIITVVVTSICVYFLIHTKKTNMQIEKSQCLSTEMHMHCNPVYDKNTEINMHSNPVYDKKMDSKDDSYNKGVSEDSHIYEYLR